MVFIRDNIFPVLKKYQDFKPAKWYEKWYFGSKYIMFSHTGMAVSGRASTSQLGQLIRKLLLDGMVQNLVPPLNIGSNAALSLV